MKDITTVLVAISSFVSVASAGDLDVRALLNRDLGDAIEIESDIEAWYCPDNTCEIYYAKEPHPDFPAYVYIHLFHKSTYAYLDLSINEVKSFRSLAVEEPDIRKTVTKYCSTNTNDVDCILSGMERTLAISTCFGRYDEGGFWGCDQFREKALGR